MLDALEVTELENLVERGMRRPPHGYQRATAAEVTTIAHRARQPLIIFEAIEQRADRVVTSLDRGMHSRIARHVDTAGLRLLPPVDIFQTGDESFDRVRLSRVLLRLQLPIALTQ